MRKPLYTCIKTLRNHDNSLMYSTTHRKTKLMLRAFSIDATEALSVSLIECA